jgi:hypothetical protein
MPTKKQYGGKTRLAKKKLQVAKKAQVELFPSFHQLFEYRSIFPKEILTFLQQYKKKYSNRLSKEDIDDMEEEGGYWEDETTKQEYIEYHKNTLRIFQVMGRHSYESNYQVDEHNLLDMNESMTDDYLDFLFQSHDEDLRYFCSDTSECNREKKYYLSKSYEDFQKLRDMPRLFLLYWSGKSTAKVGLSRKLPEDMTKMIDSYVAKNEKYEALFSTPSSSNKSRKSTSK